MTPMAGVLRIPDLMCRVYSSVRSSAQVVFVLLYTVEDDLAYKELLSEDMLFSLFLTVDENPHREHVPDIVG